MTQLEDGFRRRRPAARRTGGQQPKGDILATLDQLGIAADIEPELAVHEAQMTIAMEPPKEPEPETAKADDKPFFRRGSNGSRANKSLAEKVSSSEGLNLPPTEEPEAVAAPAPVEQEPEVEETPALPLTAPPVPIKPRVVKPSANLGKLGNKIAQMMPGAERVRVEKRLENGQLGYVGEYRKADLDGCADMHSFLVQFVKPTWGGGQYKLTGFDSANREYDAGTITLLEPAVKTEQQTSFALLAEMIKTQQKQHEEQLKELKTTMTAQPNPVTMLREVHSLQKEMAPPAPPTASAPGESALAAVISSTAQNTSMMMQMMQQQAQQQLQMFMQMMQQMQTQQQESTKLLVEMFKAEKTESRSSKGNAEPLPPPPPPESPLTAAKEIVSMLADMGVFGGGGPDGTTELLKQMVLQNQMGTKEVLGLVEKFIHRPEGGGGGSGGFKEATENMAVIMNLANQLKQNTEGSPQATVWDALAALVSNRDFASSIATAIRAGTEQQPRRPVTVVQQPTVSQQALQVAAQQRALEQQRALAAQQQQRALAAQQAARQSVAPPPAAPAPVAAAAAPTARPAKKQKKQEAAAPAPVSTPAPAPAPAAPEVEAAPAIPLITPEQFQAAVAGVSGPMPGAIPPETGLYLNKIIEALQVDDAQVVQETFNMLVYYHSFPEWEPYVKMVLEAAREGDRMKTLQIVGSFFGGWIEIGLIPREVGRRVLECASKNFETIRAMLNGEQPPEAPATAPQVDLEQLGVDQVFTVPDPQEALEELAGDEEGDEEDEEYDEDEEDEDEEEEDE